MNDSPGLLSGSRLDGTIFTSTGGDNPSGGALTLVHGCGNNCSLGMSGIFLGGDSDGCCGGESDNRRVSKIVLRRSGSSGVIGRDLAGLWSGLLGQECRPDGVGLGGHDENPERGENGKELSSKLSKWRLHVVGAADI